MRRARILRGIGANALDKVLNSVVQLAMVPLLASHWGLSVYGHWVIYATIPAFLSFSDFGFATAAANDMTMQVARGDRDAASGTFQSARLATLGTATLIIAGGTILVWSLPDAVYSAPPGLSTQATRITLTLLLIYGVVCLQQSVAMAGFRCAGRFSTGVYCHTVTFCSESLAVMGAVLLGAPPPVAAACFLASRVVMTGGQAVILKRLVPWLSFGFDRASRSEIRRLARPAGAVMALPLAQATVLQGTAVALGMAATAAAVPAFTTLRTLSRLGITLTALISMAVMPEYSAAAARGDRIVQAKLLAFTLIGSIALVVPFAAILALFGQTIVAVWTRGLIHPSLGLVLAMAAATFLGGLWNPVSNLLLARNLHASYTYAYFLLATLSVGLAYMLGGRLGAAGAGLAYLSLDICMATLLVFAARKLEISGAELRGVARATTASARRWLGHSGA